MANLTKNVPIREQSSSVFPLNKMHTTTSDFFRLDVVHCMETTAKDAITFDINTFCQSAPNPFSIDGTVTLGMHAFYVPYRIVWDKWPMYKTELESGLTPPYFTIGDLVDAFHSDANPWKEDYFDSAAKIISNIGRLSAAIPFVYNYTASSDVPERFRNFKLAAEPLRALQSIWFHYFRDKQRISDAVQDSYCLTTGGHITLTELISLLTPKFRCHSKNYFTTAFEAPSAAPDQVVPGRLATDLNPGLIIDGSGENALGVSNSPDKVYASVLQDPGVAPRSDANDILVATSVNDLRKKNAYQQYYERLLLSAKSRISRLFGLDGTAPTIEELQLPDYIGGHEEDLTFDMREAPSSTRANEGSAPGPGAFGLDPSKATIAGQQFQSMRTSGDNGFNLKTMQYKTDEEGLIFVISSICPVVQYFQGLDKMWVRGLSTFEHNIMDWPHSDMENQPLQPIPNYEVLLDSTVNPNGVYGFTEMYMDWKLAFDSLGGDYIIPTSKEYFSKLNLARDIKEYLDVLADGGDIEPYLTPAVLTQTSGVDQFIYDQKFTLSSPSVDHFRLNHKINVTASRPLMPHSLPSLSASESRNTNVRMTETGGVRL